jgi:uncharacterized protein DUF6665
MPQDPGGGRRERASIDSVIVAEKAASLGIAGRRLERALAALRRAEGEAREALLDEAAEQTWALLVQRELCGLRDRDRVVADYSIPPEVLARVGAVRRKP